MRTVFAVFAVVLLIYSTSIIAKADEKKPVVTAISNDYQLVSESALGDERNAVRKAALLWPNEVEIRDRLADPRTNGVRRAVKFSFIWLDKIMKPEWVPAVTNVSMLPLKRGLNGSDVVRWRYRVGTSIVQISSTSWGMLIAVKDGADTSKVSMADDVRAKAKTVIEKYFNHAEDMIHYSTSTVVKEATGFRCTPLDDRMGSNQWWGRFNWWTDGILWVFIVPKFDGRSVSPSDMKDWFDVEAKFDKD